MDLTLDSNVLVYAFVPPLHKDKEKRKVWEEMHLKARKLYEDIILGKHSLVIPFAVEVEVASVVSLLTGKMEYGKDLALELENTSQLVLFDSDLKDRTIDYAVKLKAGGLDNFIAITSILYGTILITNDTPFFNKIAPFSKEYGLSAKLFKEMSLREIEELK